MALRADVRHLDALRRGPIFSGRGFFRFFWRATFSGAFFIFENWRFPPCFKAFVFRRCVIMAVLADCQRFLARADFPPLIGSRGAFAAASGGFWRPVLKGKKMQLLKINNLWRKLSDYHSLHARPRVILLHARPRVILLHARPREGGAGVPRNRPFPHYQYIGPSKNFFA